METTELEQLRAYIAEQRSAYTRLRRELDDEVDRANALLRSRDALRTDLKRLGRVEAAVREHLDVLSVELQRLRAAVTDGCLLETPELELQSPEGER